MILADYDNHSDTEDSSIITMLSFATIIIMTGNNNDEIHYNYIVHNLIDNKYNHYYIGKNNILFHFFFILRKCTE